MANKEGDRIMTRNQKLQSNDFGAFLFDTDAAITRARALEDERPPGAPCWNYEVENCEECEGCTEEE